MKSAKHTKYEGNPRHAKGLQILSDREYKRLAKRAASMALAAAMAASVLSAPALAVDYDVSNGTVHTGTENDNVMSWQDGENATYTEDNKYNHTGNNDSEINITGGSTTDQVVNVGGGTTGLDITIDGVDADVENDNAVKVEDGTEVNVTITDSSLSSGGGHAAVDVDGKTDMIIQDSTLSGGDEHTAALEVRGESNVALVGSEVYGNGVGVHVEPEATLIIGGAEVQAGDLILSPVKPEQPEESGEAESGGASGSTGSVDIGWSEETETPSSVTEMLQSIIIGKTAQISEGGEQDITGTGILAEGDVIVNEDAAALVIGTDVTAYNQQKPESAAVLTGTTVGVDLKEGASLETDGTLQTYGSQVYMPQADQLDVEVQVEAAGVRAQDSSTVEVSESGNLYAEAAATQNDSRYAYSELEEKDVTSLSSKHIWDEKNQTFVQISSVGYAEDNTSSKTYSYSNKNYKENAKYYRSSSKINGEYKFYLIEETPLYSRASKKAVLTDNSTGAGILMQGNSSMNNAGYIVTPSMEIGEGTITISGLTYAGVVSKGDLTGLDAINTLETVGNGVHVVSYDEENDSLVLYYDIDKYTDDQELTVDMASVVDDAVYALQCIQSHGFDGLRPSRDPMVLPGSYYNFDFTINNKSDHEYVYKDSSFTIGALDLSAEDLSYLSARCPNEAIMALYGVDQEHDLTLEDLIHVEEKLKEQGYDSLEAYYLDYLNNKYGTQYASLDEADITKVIEITNSVRNAQYDVTPEEYERLQKLIEESGCTGELYIYKTNADGTYHVQLKETDLDGLGTLERFYSELLGVGFGRYTNSKEANNSGDRTYNTVGDYSKEEIYAAVNAYFQALANGEDPIAAGETLNIPMFFLLDGPKTNNEYQCFSFGWNSAITLTRIDPDPVPPTDPEDPTPDPDPDPDEPTLILTPVPEEEEVPEEETPLAPAPVEEIPEEETPLVDAPVIDESLEEIGEEDVPLASAPKTGDESGAFGLMAVLSGMALGVMSFFGKKKEQ